MTAWIDFFMAMCLVAVLLMVNVAAGCEPEDAEVFLAIAVAVTAVAISYVVLACVIESGEAWLDLEFPRTTWNEVWDGLEDVRE